MITKNTNFITRNKNILFIALAVALVLVLHAIAVPFMDGADWDAADYVLAGVLLFGTGLAYELAARRAGTFAYRAAVGMALAGALMLVWINAAVGIIGSDDNPANLMYIGVLAVLFAGALLARLRPHGMSRALLATAFAQALVTSIALIAGNYPDALKIVLLNGFFIALWAASAFLFRRASDTGG